MFFWFIIFSTSLLPLVADAQIYPNTLEGSCIEDLGCTSCCGGNTPSGCYCDLLCVNQYNDCCKDIYQLEYCETVKGTECESESVRLVNGLNRWDEGFAEICIFQHWRPLCNHSDFTLSEADILCQQLGYLMSSDYYDSSSDKSRTSDFIGVQSCNGNETKLTQCLLDVRYCNDNDNQLYLYCTNEGNYTNDDDFQNTTNTTTPLQVVELDYCNNILDSTSCNADCNPEASKLQIDVCCEPDNLGRFVKVNEPDLKAYIACPLTIPDWCD